MYTKLVPETANYISCNLKFIWNHLYLFMICIIYFESSAKVLSTTSVSHWTTSSSVKHQYLGEFYLKMALGSLVSLKSDLVFHCFLAMTSFEDTSCTFILKCFNCSNSWYSFIFLLRHYTRQYNQMEKSWNDE